MRRRRFFIWSVVGAVLLGARASRCSATSSASSFPCLGDNIDKAILVILAFSVIPVAYEWRKHRRSRHRAPEAAGTEVASDAVPEVRKETRTPERLAGAGRVELRLGEHRAHLEAHVGERVLPSGLRSIAQTTVSTTAPASRSARVASRTAPPVVITSSTSVTRRPATSGPSASLQVPYSLAFLRTNSAGSPVRALSTVAIGTPPSSSPPSSSVPSGHQLDHLLHDARAAARDRPRRGTCRSTPEPPARTGA